MEIDRGEQITSKRHYQAGTVLEGEEEIADADWIGSFCGAVAVEFKGKEEENKSRTLKSLTQ